MKIDNIIIQIIGNWIDQMQKKNWLLEEDREYYQYAMEVRLEEILTIATVFFCYYLYATICEWTDFSCFIFDFAKKNWWFSYEDI